jgi:peptide/nickel transport system permease protein
MLEYTVKRLIMGIFVVLAVTALLFGIMQLMPGDPIQLITNPRVSPKKIAELQRQWGLDKPVYVQYFYWLLHVFRGDFGTSIATGQKVITLIQARLPYTLLLAGSSLILQYIIAIPLGLLAAYRENSRFDNMVVVSTIILWSIPTFWLGILLILLFSIKLKILPVSGYSGFNSIILPIMTATLPYLASTLRLTRSEVLEVLREKYVITAYAKGLNTKKVLIFHVLRNALIPVTVMFFLSLPWLIGGSVIIESIFAWPGMGRLLWKAISTQDFPVVQGIIFIIAILTVISNILGDIITAYLDPRIRLEIKGDN